MTVLAQTLLTISNSRISSPINLPIRITNLCFCACRPAPIRVCSSLLPKFGPLRGSTLKLRSSNLRRSPLVETGVGKDGSSVGKKQFGRKKRVVIARFKQGLGLNGGGGGKDDGTNARVLGNLALAVGLTYLTFTGQLHWVWDALVSIWLLAFLIPIIGLGVFAWWVSKDMIEGTCPNCGNDFQIFESMLDEEEVQLCPFCSQPFSVINEEFVRESVHFSNDAAGAKRAFNGFSKKTKRGKDTSSPVVVDVEAEVKDAD